MYLYVCAPPFNEVYLDRLLGYKLAVDFERNAVGYFIFIWYFAGRGG